MKNKSINTQHIIAQILQSKSLADSEKSRNLLMYLYEQSQKNIVTKEIDIAIDIFKRDGRFNPTEDTIVRVALHKLRQKLALYYETEGKRDKVQIAIPKGHYQVVFEKRLKTESSTRLFISKSLNYILIISLCILITIFALEKRQKNQQHTQWNIVHKNNPVWGDIIHSNRPLVLAIGNLYLITDKENSILSNPVIRDSKINSQWELNLFIGGDKNLKDRLVPHTNYHFFPEYSYTTLADILPNFIYHNLDVTIMPASDLTAEHFTQSNIIFIGYYKTANSFHNYIGELAFDIDINSETISGINPNIIPNGKISPTQDPKKHHSDISYAAKFPGSNGNTIFMFMGFRLAGVQDVVRQYCQQNRLKKVTDNLVSTFGECPQYFQVISRIEGFARNEIKSDIIDIYSPNFLNDKYRD